MRTRTIYLLRYWVPVVVWMGFIFAMSTGMGSASHTSRFVEPLLRWLIPGISQAAVEHVHFIVRKGGHLGEYFVFGLLLWRALLQTTLADPRGIHWEVGLAALLLSAAYAATDEFHQSFVPTRTASMRDVLIDTSGAFLGLGVVFTSTALFRKVTDEDADD